jgi:hypothetical protein
MRKGVGGGTKCVADWSCQPAGFGDKYLERGIINPIVIIYLRGLQSCWLNVSNEREFGGEEGDERGE